MRRSVVAPAALALLFGGTPAGQVRSWRTVSHQGLTLEMPSDWIATQGNRRIFQAPDKGTRASFDIIQPIRASSFTDFDQWTREWLQGVSESDGAIDSRKHRVAGFDAVTFWFRDGRRSEPLRETLIGVFDPPPSRAGSVYSFTISGGSDAETLAIYERMLSSMRIDSRTLR